MSPDRGLLILLHGYDDDPADFDALATQLAPPGWVTQVPRGAIVVGNDRLAWFETVEGEPDPIQLRDALNDLDAIVGEAAATHQIDLSDIVVAGFSQGAALSLAWLLDSGERGFERSSIGGIIAVAPWFIDAEGLSLDPARGAGVAVFIGHGTDDDIVPLPLGRGAARLLERNGALIEFRELAAAHALAPFLAVGRDWLAALLTGPSNASPI